MELLLAVVCPVLHLDCVFFLLIWRILCILDSNPLPFLLVANVPEFMAWFLGLSVCFCSLVISLSGQAFFYFEVALFSPLIGCGRFVSFLRLSLLTVTELFHVFFYGSVLLSINLGL